MKASPLLRFPLVNVRRRAQDCLMRITLASLRAAAARCRACPLWQRGTQTVFGEGERRATVMFVGEHRFVPSPLAPRVLAPVHPPAILRAPDDETRHAEMKRFVADLRKVATVVRRRAAA